MYLYNSDTNADTNTDTNTDIGTDISTDTNTDTVTDTDINTDTDTDTNVDTDTDNDLPVEASVGDVLVPVLEKITLHAVECTTMVPSGEESTSSIETVEDTMCTVKNASVMSSVESLSFPHADVSLL